MLVLKITQVNPSSIKRLLSPPFVFDFLCIAGGCGFINRRFNPGTFMEY